MIRSLPFEQTLVGSYRPEGDVRELALEVKLDAKPAKPFGALSGKPLSVTGSVFADGLATQQPVSGQVDLRRFSTGAGAYQLSFAADDGRKLRLLLRRHAALRTPVFSFSRFVGELLDDAGDRLAQVELRVDLRRTLRRWLVM